MTTINIDNIKWLLDNATSYAISKHCGMSTQAVDKYKHGTADLMNMRLKHGLAMSQYAQNLKNDK